MNLADGDQWRGRVSGDRLGQKPSIPGHHFPAVGGGKAEIQLARRALSAPGPAGTAFARAEAEPEPVDLLPAGNRQPLDAVRGHAGHWLGLRQLFRCRVLKVHATGDTPGLATEVTRQARLVKESVDGPDFRVGMRVWGGR